MTARHQPDDSYRSGLRLAREGRHAEAIACFEIALGERPNDTRVLFALGNTAAALGHGQAAENFFRLVLVQEPHRLEALVNLANLLRRGNRTADIIALLKPALERDPSQAELWLTLGSALREAGDAKTAENFYREALRLKPDYAPALGNLADLLGDQGALDEALALYARAVAAEPENVQARLNRAILYFLKGDLGRAWDDYEYRLRVADKTPVSDHGLKRWDGSDARERLLVAAEQGIGDQIMFASLIPELAASFAQNGGTPILEAEPRLVPLFARSFPGVRVFASKLESRGGVKHARYDWLKEAGGADRAIPIGSLPRLMRRQASDFPSPHAYLIPDASERAHWSQWLRTQGNGPFVGISWRSGSLGGLRNLQYAPMDCWADFIRALPGTPVSLQYGASAEEIATLEKMSGRTILAPPNIDQKQEIDRTLALIAALDAAVSAPTSVAWMASGAGLPTVKRRGPRSFWTKVTASSLCLSVTKRRSPHGCSQRLSALARLSLSTARPRRIGSASVKLKPSSDFAINGWPSRVDRKSTRLNSSH